MVPVRLRRMLVLWAQLVLMSESRQVASWRGVCLRLLPVRNGAHLPGHMWEPVAQLALVSALARISCSAERGVQSPYSHFPSKGRLGSICLLAFQVSHFPWHNDDRA